MYNKKWMSCILFLCMGIGLLVGNAKNVHASKTDAIQVEDLAEETYEATLMDENYTGVNTTSNEIITGMDENGNVYTVDTSVGAYQGLNPYMRALTPALVDFHTKSSSVVTYYTEYSTGASGYTNGAYGADAVYLGTVDGKVKFMMSGVVGLVSVDDVNIVAFDEASSYSYYGVNGSGRLIHYITTDISGATYASKLDNGPAPSYLQTNVKYLSYDGHYFYTVDQFGLMQSDYNDGHRNNAINADNPYFNYYQYLPFRSYSDYIGDELSEMIHSFTTSTSVLNDLGETFIECQEKYGTNALLVAGIAANESGWGTSNISKTKNNIFGINAVDSSPGQSANVFDSVEDCINDYTETYLSKRYCRPKYTYYHGAFLGNKASGANVSYASDPYWGEKAAAIAWKLDGAGGNGDVYKYTIGIVNPISTMHSDVNIRTEATTASTVVHTTGTASAQAFLITDKTTEAGFYKIQSPGVLNSTRTAINVNSGVYTDFQMYLYLSANYMTIVNEGNESSALEYNAYVSDMEWMSVSETGELAGTTGKKLPVHALSVRVNDIEGVGITYRAHVSKIGWQDFVSDGETAGVIGNSLNKIEAIEMKLTGENADKYDIYYSVHSSKVGWLDWAKNGESAGTSGYAYPMEAIKIVLVEKGAAAPGSTACPYMDATGSEDSEENQVPILSYSTHVRKLGWTDAVSNGEVSGTTGQSLRIEALKIEISGNFDVGLSYQGYVQKTGWQDAVSEGEIAGTTGQQLRMEAIRILLTGTDADKFDIYYRTHVAKFGWLDWAKNGETAGTAEYGYQMEALQIYIVEKGGDAPGATDCPFKEKETVTVEPVIQIPSLSYSTHVRTLGWLDPVTNGETSGTIGKSLRMEAIKIDVAGDADVGLSYETHVQKIGWQDAVAEGEIAGTTGQALRMEAIRISLTGADADQFDIYYRTHVAKLGWLDWAKNGESAGSAGYGYQMEAIEICIVKKGDTAPGATSVPFAEKK